MRRSPLGLVSLAALTAVIVLALPAPASAAQSTLDLLLDLDNDATTGCTVVTPDGPFDGVEQILITTLDTVGAGMADVISVERRECIDPGTGTFGPLIAVDPGGWPVGVGLGVDGFNVVETYFPFAATALDLSVVRFGVVHTRGMEADALLVAAPASDVPLLIGLQNVLEIPTLGEWGLLLLALLLAASSLALLGRRGRVVLVLVLLLGTAGLAWAQCVLDGLPDDWGLGDLLGEDPAVADDGISIRAVFGRGEAGQLCFRVDLSLQFDQPPTITPITDQTIPEDGTTGALAFTVGDLETPVGTLIVTATSSNQILVPDASLVLGGAGANRTITVTPLANQNGMTTVTLTVQDGAGNTTSTSFLVTVTSLNDPPTITPIADQVILEDSTTGPLAFTVGDTETAAAALIVTASSSNQAIIPNANLVLGGAGANRTITVTPVADQNGGPVIITVTVQDADGGSVPTQLTVTVTPVNDAPSFVLAGDVVSDEDAGPQTVMGQATAISPGPANEAGQTVSFLVSNDANALFSAQPAIDAAGTLTYTSAPNAFGTAIVTVQAMDDGGTANGGVDTSAAQTFTITVNAVNDPPMLTTNVINYSAVGNTLLRVDGATDGLSGGAGHDVPLPGRIASTTDATDAFMAVGPTDPDTPPASLGFVPGAYPTMLGGVVTIDDDGDFFYVPPVGVQGVDTVMLTFTDGGTNLPVTLNITISEMVWYVEDTVDGAKNPTAGGPGNSLDAFETLAAAQAASAPNDYILVFETDAPLDQTITLKAGQKLYGQPIEDVAPGLLPGGMLLEEIVDTNVRPVINRTTGDAVRVVANVGNGDRPGVEIRSLDLTGDDNAIDVSAADANNLDISLSDNVLSSVTGPSLLVNGAGSTGTTVVRELGGTSVGSSGAGGGEIFESVTFDADVATAGIQPVAAGNVNVGNPGAPGDVVGHGVRLNNVRGVLDFGILNVGNTGGVGLFVRDADGKPGTFVVDTDGGAINTVNGPAVDLDPVGLGLGGADGMVLSSVTANVTVGMVPYGINLHTVAGSFQVTGSTAVGASGAGILTSGISATDATAAVTFTGPTTVSNIAGPGIALTNVDGPVTVASIVSSITGTGGAAIDVDQGLGDVTYNGSITNTAGRSVEITNHEGPGGGSTVSLTGSITDSGMGIFLDNNDQGAGGTVINLTGALNLTTGASNAFTATNGGVVNVTDPANNNLAATTTGTGVIITNTTIGGSGVKFTTVNVGDANPAAPNAANGILLTNVGANPFTATGGLIDNVTTRGLDVSGGTGNVTVGTSIHTTTTGRSLEVTGHTGGTVAVSGTLDDDGLGVNLDSNTGSTINITGNVDIDTVGANTGFNATGGGTLNVMTGVNLVDTSLGTGVAVNIVNTTIGTSGVTFQAVSANGAPIGILLDNAGTTGFFSVTGTGSTAGSGGTIQNTTQNGALIRTTDNVSLSNINFASASNDGGGAGSCDATVFTGCNAAVELETVTNADLFNLAITGAEDHGIFGQMVTDLDISNTSITGLGADVDTNEHGIFIRGLLGTVAGTTDSVFDGVTVTDAQDTAILIQNDVATSPGNPMSPDQLTVSNSVLTSAGDSGLNVQTVAVPGNLRLVATGNMVTDTVDGIDAEASAGNLQAMVGGAGPLANTISAGVGGDLVNGILFFASASNGAATVDATATGNFVTLDAVKLGMPPVAPVSGLNGIGVSAGGASLANLGTIRATVQGNTINSSFSGVLTQTVHGVIVTNEGTGTTSQNVVTIDGNVITLDPPAGTTTAETVGIGVDGGITGAGTTVRSTNNTIIATGDASNGASVGIQILPTEVGDPAGTGTRVCVRVTGNDVTTPNNPFAAAFSTTELDVIAAPVITGSFLDVEAIPVGPRTTAQLKADLEPLNTNTEVGDPGGAVAGTITGVMACPN